MLRSRCEFHRPISAEAGPTPLKWRIHEEDILLRAGAATTDGTFFSRKPYTEITVFVRWEEEKCIALSVEKNIPSE